MNRAMGLRRCTHHIPDDDGEFPLALEAGRPVHLVEIGAVRKRHGWLMSYPRYAKSRGMG